MIEEREELMISPTGSVAYKKKAHFLKPTVAAMEGQTLKLPSLSPKCKWPLEVGFNGWKTSSPRKWKEWVEIMESKYKSVWKKAGIHGAIMASTYEIRRNHELILNVVERWCVETNTFVFPWGEATVTLEDMIVLGGLSVLGCPVSMPLQGEDLISICEELKNARKHLMKLNNNCYGQWLSMFMEGGDEIEHEAFLSMWLSRYVFPGKHIDRVNEQVFPVAVHLARGVRIALAPAVLANIYRDLSLLKETMASAALLSGEDGGESLLAVTVWAPLQLVQVWVWERLVVLQPEPNFIEAGEPRLARWHAVKQADEINIRPAIDSAGGEFLWRPYALALDEWSLPSFYREKEEWVLLGEGLDEDLESFARCLRACELNGTDCRVVYQPHRVAMQFGYDQDLPQSLPPSNTDQEMAWYNYIRPFGDDACLYLPSRLSETDVSHTYMGWWRRSVTVLVGRIRGMKQRPRSAKRSRTVKHTKDVVIKNEPDVPPGFPPKYNATGEEKHVPGLPRCTGSANILQQPVKIKTEPEPDVPPGFTPKRKRVEENPHTPVVILQKHNARYSKEGTLSEPDVVPPGFPPKHQVAKEDLCSSPCNNSRGSEEKRSPSAGTEASRSSKSSENSDKQVLKHDDKNVHENKTENLHHPTSFQGEEHKSISSSSTFELPSFVDLTARISRLESLVAGLQNNVVI